MLKIVVPSTEEWDEEKQEFSSTKEQALVLEHSLVSLSKWESKWNKAFLTSKEKTFEETIDYIKCMTITQNVRDEVYSFLTNKNISEINRYIDHPMTATYFSKDSNKDKNTSGDGKTTSEVIYYWMISQNIPIECQKWHLNRLLTLIEVCNLKNTPPKKANKKELMSRNASLNAQRRKNLNTKG